MYEIKVEIVQAEILQTPPAGGLHMVGVVESVPQLGGHEQLLSAADPGLYGLSDTSPNLGANSSIMHNIQLTFSRLFLVPVVTGPVNVSVASLDDIFYQGLGLLLLNLPAAVTDGRNLPGRQSKACSRHFSASVDVVCVVCCTLYPPLCSSLGCTADTLT